MWPLWKGPLTSSTPHSTLPAATPVKGPPSLQRGHNPHDPCSRGLTRLAPSLGRSSALPPPGHWNNLCAVIASSCSQVLFSLFSRSRIEKHNTGWFCKHTSSLAIVCSSLEPKKANRLAGFRSQYHSHASPSQAPANTCQLLQVTQTDPWSLAIWPSLRHCLHPCVTSLWPFVTLCFLPLFLVLPWPSLISTDDFWPLLLLAQNTDRVIATQDIRFKLCLCRNSEAHLWQVQARRISSCFLVGSMPENPNCGFSAGMEPVFEVDRISAMRNSPLLAVS